MVKQILKNDVEKLLGCLSEFDIHGPVAEENVIRYKQITSFADLVLSHFTNSKKPPKEIFFPQTEKMFDFTMEGKTFVGAQDPILPEKPLLILGMRPCDARAITVMDRLFRWDYIDPYYVNRRDRSTIISFTCIQPEMPEKNCFCTSIGGSPSSTENVDMLWTDLGDSYLVESFSDKGNDILDKGNDIFTDAGPDHEAEAARVKEQVEGYIQRTFEFEGLREALENTFDHQYWKDLSQRCLGCGICTLLCPTCHCFDINDIVTRGKGWRERTWDSCQYPYYSAHASGHNPRPEKKHRQRNRIYHKFLYLDKNLDVLGCVGCGRCISNCPVNIDIIEVAHGVKNVTCGGDKGGDLS